MFDIIQHNSTIFCILWQYSALFNKIRIFFQKSTLFYNIWNYSTIFDLNWHYSTQFGIFQSSNVAFVKKCTSPWFFSIQPCCRCRKMLQSILVGGPLKAKKMFLGLDVSMCVFMWVCVCEGHKSGAAKFWKSFLTGWIEQMGVKNLPLMNLNMQNLALMKTK